MYFVPEGKVSDVPPIGKRINSMMICHWNDASLGRPVPWTTRPLDVASLERRGSFRMRPLVDVSLTNVCTEISWKVSNFFLFTPHSVCGKKPKTIEIRGQLKKI
jgi:hypothetical protein